MNLFDKVRAEREQAKAALGAWEDQFGTTQLSHAVAMVDQLRADNAQAAEAFEQLAHNFPQIQVDCDSSIAAAQAINAAYDQLRAEKERLEKTCATLRRDLADPPGDVQELVIQKLNLVSADALTQLRADKEKGEAEIKDLNSAWDFLFKLQPITGMSRPEVMRRVIADKEKAEKACAEMRKVIGFLEYTRGGFLLSWPDMGLVKDALSSTCGQGYVSNDYLEQRLKEVRAEYDAVLKQREEMRKRWTQAEKHAGYVSKEELRSIAQSLIDEGHTSKASDVAECLECATLARLQKLMEDKA